MKKKVSVEVRKLSTRMRDRRRRYKYVRNHVIYLRFTSTISIVVLVLVSCVKILGIFLFDLCICHVITDTRVKLVQRFPLQLVVLVREVFCGCDCSPESRRPDSERVLAFFLQRYQHE
jgi:hypothetical protein